MSGPIALPLPQALPLRDRVILVTGASGGLGAAAARACATAGARAAPMGSATRNTVPRPARLSTLTRWPSRLHSRRTMESQLRDAMLEHYGIKG